MSDKTGYAAALLIHGTLVALGAFIAAGSTPTPEPAEAPPVTIFGPAGESTGTPGGAGPGSPGTPTSTANTPFKSIERVDAGAYLDSYRENRRRQEAAAVAAAAALTPVRTSPVVKAGDARPRPAQTARTRPPGQLGDRAAVPFIKGSSLPTLTAVGPGSGPTGMPTGTPGPGGTGGPSGPGDSGAAAEQSWKESVRQAFAAIYIPRFRAQGSDMATTRDQGEFKLLISPSGRVAWDGWITRPTDPVVIAVTESAVAEMPSGALPPGGIATRLSLRVAGVLADD